MRYTPYNVTCSIGHEMKKKILNILYGLQSMWIFNYGDQTTDLYASLDVNTRHTNGFFNALCFTIINVIGLAACV